MSQDKLWELEALEGAHGLEGIRSRAVLLYKVVSQHRVIAIVEVDSLENLDRNSMGWLPMREYLEFEQVWALRDYPGFVEDVKTRFPQPPPPDRERIAEVDTLRVAQSWFENLGRGDFQEALKLVDPDVVWENIAPVPGVTDLAPWLGSYRGLPAVVASFDVWARHSRMLSMNLEEPLIIDGATAMAIVHEHAQCVANDSEYDLHMATQLTVRDAKIKRWKVYWDPAPLIRAYRNL